MRETEELTADRKKILEKLMDQDEEEPEVGAGRICIMINDLDSTETENFVSYAWFDLFFHQICSNTTIFNNNNTHFRFYLCYAQGLNFCIAMTNFS